MIKFQNNKLRWDDINNQYYSYGNYFINKLRKIKILFLTTKIRYLFDITDSRWFYFQVFTLLSPYITFI